MTQPFTMKTQLVIGRAGEAFLLGAHPELRWPRKGERRWDLEGGAEDGTRRTLEVKCDTYPHDDTPNFFMERCTNLRKLKRSIDGGPWRSLAHGVTEFAYLFTNGGTKGLPSDPVCYWFTDVPALVAKLDAMIVLGLPTRRVRSLDVSALGYLVRRSALADLATVTVYRAA